MLNEKQAEMGAETQTGACAALSGSLPPVPEPVCLDSEQRVMSGLVSL